MSAKHHSFWELSIHPLPMDGWYWTGGCTYIEWFTMLYAALFILQTGYWYICIFLCVQSYDMSSMFWHSTVNMSILKYVPSVIFFSTSNGGGDHKNTTVQNQTAQSLVLLLDLHVCQRCPTSETDWFGVAGSKKHLSLKLGARIEHNALQPGSNLYSTSPTWFKNKHAHLYIA